MKSPSQKIAFSILTTGNYLDSLENSSILNNIRRSHPPITSITEEQFENQIDDVHPYVITANEMLKNNFSVDEMQMVLDFFNENNYVVDKIFENKIYKESEVGDDLNGTNEFTIIAKKNLFHLHL